MTDYDQRHGGPYDRGAADSYYMRLYKPHYYVGGTGKSPPIFDLTDDELEAYEAGWIENETTGDRKNWG